jgi:hypothetical protein
LHQGDAFSRKLTLRIEFVQQGCAVQRPASIFLPHADQEMLSEISFDLVTSDVSRL